MPPPPPRSRWPPRPGFSYSAPSTVSGKPRSHMRIHPGHPGILVIMGRFIASPPHPTSPVCSTNLGTPPTPFSGYPQHPSSNSCSPSARRARMDTPELDRINTRDPTWRNRSKHRRSTQNSRMATASNNPRAHGQLQWTTSRHPPSQPGPAPIPSWPLRQPCLHHHSLFYRVWVPFPSFSDPRIRRLCLLPPPSWPCWRPPRRMCSVCREGGGQSHHQYPTRWPQHPEPVQGRRPTTWGHRQRATNVGGQPTSSRYNFGITAHRNRGTKVTRRDLCRSSRRTAEQGTHLPRTVKQQKMSPGRPWNRSRRQVEQWSFQLHLHARQSPSPIQPSLPPSSHQRSPRLALVSCPYSQAAATSFAASLCCSKISLPTTTMTETLATSFRTRAPCLSVASQHGSGRSGLTPSLPHAHLETGQYKNSLCLEAATALCQWTFCGAEGEKKKQWMFIFAGCFDLLSAPPASLNPRWQPDRSWSRKDAAKACVAACVSMALQRWIRALAREWRRRAGVWRALVGEEPEESCAFIFFSPFSRTRSLVDDCFTGQSPGSAISIPAAPDVHEGLGQIQASAP